LYRGTASAVLFHDIVTQRSHYIRYTCDRAFFGKLSKPWSGGCDLIVCREDNWPEGPFEVLELREGAQQSSIRMQTGDR